jgi:hypothetical protein
LIYRPLRLSPSTRVFAGAGRRFERKVFNSVPRIE